MPNSHEGSPTSINATAAEALTPRAAASGDAFKQKALGFVMAAQSTARTGVKAAQSFDPSIPRGTYSVPPSHKHTTTLDPAKEHVLRQIEEMWKEKSSDFWIYEWYKKLKTRARQHNIVQHLTLSGQMRTAVVNTHQPYTSCCRPFMWAYPPSMLHFP